MFVKLARVGCRSGSGTSRVTAARSKHTFKNGWILFNRFGVALFNNLHDMTECRSWCCVIATQVEFAGTTGRHMMLEFAREKPSAGQGCQEQKRANVR